MRIPPTNMSKTNQSVWNCILKVASDSWLRMDDNSPAAKVLRFVDAPDMGKT